MPAPATDAERLVVAEEGVNADGGVVDNLGRQLIEGEPAHGGAFVGFAVGGLADPASSGKEQPEAWFRAGAVDVNGVDVVEVSGVHEHTDFFFYLAGRRVEHGFTGVKFAGGKVPMAVKLGVAVAALSEQQPAAVNE